MTEAPPTLWPDDLVLSASTLGSQTPLAERVEAAAEAGFTGVGLRPSDRDRALAAGSTDDELQTLVRRRGLRVVELQALGNWGLSGEAAEQSRRHEEALYELAAALGGSHVIAVGEVGPDVVSAARRFAAVCDRAAAHGLRVALEFVPWTTIPDARAAWAIVERADRSNGGVLVDAWHHFRGAADETALLAIPAERILAVHLCDAGAPVGPPVEDARHRRLLPGEGSFDLDRFLRLLADHGVRAPVGVEVLSDRLHAMPARAVADAAAASARTVLGAALGAVPPR